MSSVKSPLHPNERFHGALPTSSAAARILQRVGTMIRPIWKPQNPSLFGERYFFYSPKLRRIVANSSKLEYERALLLEGATAVTRYCEQPCEAVAHVDGRLGRSRLDFWVQFSSGTSRFEEVKYRSELDDPSNRAHRQIAIQKQWCEVLGFTHAVVTDAEVWQKPVLIGSLRTLLHEYDSSYESLAAEARGYGMKILSVVGGNAGISVHEVLASRPEAAQAKVYRLAVMELVRLGRVDAQMEKAPFSPRSCLRCTVISR